MARGGGTTVSGELVFAIFAALAQFERQLIVERTKAGLTAARTRGKQGGRPKITANDPRVRMVKALHRDATNLVQEICQTLGISRATLYRWLRMGG